MRVFLPILALLCGTVSAMDKVAFTEVDAIKAVASGVCGSLPVGTGLVRGKGWLHQPIPGPVVVRLSGGGTVATIGQPAAASITLDMYAGRQSYIVVDAPRSSVLEWKVPGFAWGAVPVGFQLAPVESKMNP